MFLNTLSHVHLCHCNGRKIEKAWIFEEIRSIFTIIAKITSDFVLYETRLKLLDCVSNFTS